MQAGVMRVPNLEAGSLGTVGVSDSTREVIGLMQKSMEFQSVLARCAESRNRFGMVATAKVEGIKSVAELTREAIKKAA